ncbi:T9SS type A sorting domain-containing protein [Tamlana fucoidanivorans]|uniref:T9SS type A sorting domain-containing protein n=1 Tax=Allotamlana fucoidanivorans TaxID=2583814 RepID=A0A5C4SMU0_9FLAO|nr:T9SS type A sorting domain-containing protein [Tamlana fucoidanivorans]TNJ44890.1 T9SS type A sorting domain-containing protein [Tamlana fucoidanivorans]
MKKQVLFLMTLVLSISMTFAQHNWTNGSGNNKFEDDGNWDVGYYPQFGVDEAIFDGNTSNADCVVTQAHTFGLFTAGVGSDYGTITIKSGGSIETTDGRWAAIGWTTQANLVVEPNATFKTKSHLWLAFNPGAKSYIDCWGTIEVGEMFGVNFEGLADANSDCRLTVRNGGLLKLAQLKGDDNDPASTKSFNGAVSDDALEVMGGGKVTIVGDLTAVVNDYVTKNKIVAPGGSVVVAYDAVADLTEITSTAAPLSVKDFSSFDFQVYPNPSSNVISIQSKSAVANIKLYNMLGQQVLERFESASINVSKLNSGYYILKAQDESGNLGVKKVLIK